MNRQVENNVRITRQLADHHSMMLTLVSKRDNQPNYLNDNTLRWNRVVLTHNGRSTRWFDL